MKRNKLFITIILIFTFNFFIIFGIVNYFLYKTPQNTLWVNNCFIVKEKYAKAINTPKIVFVSGSNTLYGINTIDVEEELKIASVNMAIQADLKTDYILDRVKRVLSNGDTVIIPFEYSNYIWEGEQSAARTDYILTHDKKYFNNMDIYEKLSMLYSINITTLFESIWQQLKAPVKAKIGKGYNVDTLNKNGDETYKSGNKSKIFNTTYKPFELIEFRETKGLLLIKDFSDWCKKNNIKLFITYPNTINHKEYFQNPYLNYFQSLKEYFHTNNINVIGNPHDSMYPLKYFYDTHYHMNTEGAQIRTKKLIKELKSKIL